MEINKQFETYIIIDDEEFKVEVQAVGDLVPNGIDNVFVNNIYDIENDETLSFKDLDRHNQKFLFEVARDELNEQEMWETHDE